MDRGTSTQDRQASGRLGGEDGVPDGAPERVRRAREGERDRLRMNHVGWRSLVSEPHSSREGERRDQRRGTVECAAQSPANDCFKGIEHPTSMTRRQRWRAGVDHLLERSEFLPQEERELINAVFRNGTSVVRLAKLTGNPSAARRLRRRVHLIVERALSGSFAAMARCLSRGEAGDWPRTRKRVGELLFIEGKTLRQAAVELRRSVHWVRAHRTALEAIFESETR